MRKVMLLKMVYEHPKHIEDDCEAKFIQWGIDAIEHTEGFAQQTIAVCEKADGSIVCPTPTQIRFIDAQPAEQPRETCKWMRCGCTASGVVLYTDPHNQGAIRRKESFRVDCPTCGKKIEG